MLSPGAIFDLKIHRNAFSRTCTKVSGVENIGQCGRLSQLSSAGFLAHFNIVTYLLTYLLCGRGI